MFALYLHHCMYSVCKTFLPIFVTLRIALKILVCKKLFCAFEKNSSINSSFLLRQPSYRLVWQAILITTDFTEHLQLTCSFRDAYIIISKTFLHSQ